MPSVPGGDINTVRFMFLNNMVHTYKLKVSDIDADELQRELDFEDLVGQN